MGNLCKAIAVSAFPTTRLRVLAVDLAPQRNGAIVPAVLPSMTDDYVAGVVKDPRIIAMAMFERSKWPVRSARGGFRIVSHQSKPVFGKKRDQPLHPHQTRMAGLFDEVWDIVIFTPRYML